MELGSEAWHQVLPHASYPDPKLTSILGRVHKLNKTTTPVPHMHT